jgi:hypothetical protein
LLRVLILRRMVPTILWDGANPGFVNGLQV